MIRVAQQGRTIDSPAETLDEVIAGFRCMWVEIDGVRLTAEDHGLVSFSFTARNGEVTIPEVVLRLVGPVEVVYLDGDGNELGAEPFPDFAGTLGGDSLVRRDR